MGWSGALCVMTVRALFHFTYDTVSTSMVIVLLALFTFYLWCQRRLHKVLRDAICGTSMWKVISTSLSVAFIHD